MGVRGENVHTRAANIQRQQAQPLDRVDHEEDAALPAERRELLEGKDPAVVKRDPGNGDDPRPRVARRGDILERDPAAAVLRDPALDAARLEGPPRIRVRRKLQVVGYDVVAGLPRERQGDEVDCPGRVRQEGDLVGAGADEARGLRARRFHIAEGAPPVGRAAVPCVLDVPDHRVRDAAGQRRDAGVVEVNEALSDGELRDRGSRG